MTVYKTTILRWALKAMTNASCTEYHVIYNHFSGLIINSEDIDETFKVVAGVPDASQSMFRSWLLKDNLREFTCAYFCFLGKDIYACARFAIPLSSDTNQAPFLYRQELKSTRVLSVSEDEEMPIDTELIVISVRSQ